MEEAAGEACMGIIIGVEEMWVKMEVISGIMPGVDSEIGIMEIDEVGHSMLVSIHISKGPRFEGDLIVLEGMMVEVSPLVIPMLQAVKKRIPNAL